MDKTAFVTGGAGFLGRNLINALLRQEWHVTALVRGPRPDWMQREGLTVRHGSLQNEAATAAAMPMHVQAVFHLAGAITMWSGDLDTLVRDNVMATQNLLQAAMARQAQRVVMTSTLGIFRTDLGPVNEQTELRSLKEKNPYLRTKHMADDLLVQAASAGLSTVSLHPSHMLGAFDKAGWIKMFSDVSAGKVKAAPGGRASFCSVGDVALAHLAAAQHPCPAARYVLGGPVTTYLDMFNRIGQRVNAKPITATAPAMALKAIGHLSQLWASVSSQRPAMTPGLAEILTGDMVADARLAEAQLGYRPDDLEAMLDEAHAYWRETQSLLDFRQHALP